jgi:hypothetical protein
VYPTNSDFFAHERIAELMRVSSDIHRGPDGGSRASHLATALAGPLRWLSARRSAAASAVVSRSTIHRPAART